MKCYSTKSNAKRAADKDGRLYDIVDSANGWRVIFKQQGNKMEDQLNENNVEETVVSSEETAPINEELEAARAAMTAAGQHFREVCGKVVSDNEDLQDAKASVGVHKASVNEATKNLKACQNYLDKLPVETADEDKAAAQANIDGWAAELGSRKAAYDNAVKAHEHQKDVIKSSREMLKDAKKSVKAAEKAYDKLNKPNRAARRAHDITENGVNRPKDGTKTGRVWEITDELKVALGRAPLLKEVREVTDSEGISHGTANTQYARWTVFNGVTAADRSAIRSSLKAS